MKIAFLGAPSTGKSTLSARVAKELHLPHIPEVVPIAMKETGITAEDLVKGEGEDLVRFQQAMYRATKSEEDKHHFGFVQDSALLEVQMYIQYFCLRYMSLQLAEQMYEEAVVHSVRNYDAMFFLPSGVIPIADNGFRNTNPVMNRAFDALLRRLIGDARKRGAYVKTVAAANLEHRVSFVKEEMKRLYSSTAVGQLVNARALTAFPSAGLTATWPTPDNSFVVFPAQPNHENPWWLQPNTTAAGATR